MKINKAWNTFLEAKHFAKNKMLGYNFTANGSSQWKLSD